ncbi:MAG: carboxypeptidase-like regulatory domain-containing protein [Terracidiphilus sp.]|nr:carboxypeptidase-like regulatory domain-containing protein [Terracidiphilus sp.]
MQTGEGKIPLDPCEVQAKTQKYQTLFSRILLVLLVFVLAIPTALVYGQSTTTADILGTVTDASGAALAKATTTLTNLATKDTRVFTTDDSGSYTFQNLNPGHYQIGIRGAGFQNVNISDVAISAGDRRRLDQSLVVGGSSETITMESSAPVLQTDSSAIGSTVGEQAVQDLPLNGRNYINLVQNTPGANEGGPNGLGSGARPDDRRQSSSVSANGQGDVLNNQLIDGMDNNERLIGTIGVRPSIDAIAEVRVLTNNYPADVGRSAGAVINIITKAGTNSYHGSVYEYLRNDVLNTFSYQFGATIQSLSCVRISSVEASAAPSRRTGRSSLRIWNCFAWSAALLPAALPCPRFSNTTILETFPILLRHES